MAVAYHTHSFDVPEATDEQAAAGLSREVFLVPANLPPLLAEKQGLNDALTSIAGLTTSADQMIYTTGADAYATTALTAYGRDIVGSIDASAVLTLLGAGTTGTALFQDETAADARTTLELGSLATLNTISNTNWSGADLAIENGGTGASSIEAARTNLGLGTAATADSTAFATSAQGLLADSAVQPGDGEAVPIGGTTGQVLAKASATDGDTFWTIAGQGDIISTNNGSDFADADATKQNLGTSILKADLATLTLPVSTLPEIEVIGYYEPGDKGASVFVKDDENLEPIGFGDEQLDAPSLSGGSWVAGTGWTISGGVATRTAQASQSNIQNSAVTFVAGQELEVTFEITARTGGSVRPVLTGGSATVAGTYRSAVGVYRERLTVTSPTANTGFVLQADAAFAGSIDWVTVKTVIALPDAAKTNISDGVSTFWYKSRPDFVTPQMCGARANGRNVVRTSDHQAFQDMFDWMTAEGIPGKFSGSFYMNDTARLDWSRRALSNNLGLNLEGAGEGCTEVILDGDIPAFDFYTSNDALAQAYGTVGKFSMRGATSRNGIGIKADKLAFTTFDQIEMFNLEYPIYGTDLLITRFKKLVARRNKYGVYLEQDSGSPPNAITFDDFTLNNDNWGVKIIGGRQPRFRNGTLEDSGDIGTDTVRGGLWFVDMAGPCGAVIDGVYITHNEGLADIIIDAGTEDVLFDIRGNQFTRINSARYTENNILVRHDTGDGRVDIVLTGNQFTSLNTYVEDPSRPYVGVEGTDGSLVTVRDNGNLFQTESSKGAVDTHKYKEPGFSAHKGAVAQSGIANMTATKVTFSTEEYDHGGYFSGSTWTPPAGKVHLEAAVAIDSGIQDGGLNAILIYKNGSAFKNVYSRFNGTGLQTVSISLEDDANGTDTYEVYYQGATATTLNIAGEAVRTWFMGTVIK